MKQSKLDLNRQLSEASNRLEKALRHLEDGSDNYTEVQELETLVEDLYRRVEAQEFND